MFEKLLALGFTGDICTATIGGTIDRMFQQMETHPDLADAVLEAVRADSDPDPVSKDNYDEVLFDWIAAQAEALHAQHTLDLLAPFKAIASLF